MQQFFLIYGFGNKRDREREIEREPGEREPGEREREREGHYILFPFSLKFLLKVGLRPMI